MITLEPSTRAFVSVLGARCSCVTSDPDPECANHRPPPPFKLRIFLLGLYYSGNQRLIYLGAATGQPRVGQRMRAYSVGPPRPDTELHPRPRLAPLIYFPPTNQPCS